MSAGLFLGQSGKAGGSDGGSPGTPGAVDSVNNRTGAVTLNKNDVGLGNVNNTSDVNKQVSAAQAAADTAVLNAAQSYADNLVVGLLDDRGNFDASGNVFPSSGGSGASGAVKKGDLWTISVAGTLGGANVTVGDAVRALTDAPGQTAANWTITENNLGFVPENSANKNASNGFVGLSGFKIQFKNLLNTFTSFFQNSNTAARTYTFQDRDGTIADNTDLAAKSDRLAVPLAAITGTSATLDATMLDRVQPFSSNSDITVTIPTGLGAGFNCALHKTNAAANKITVIGASGVTTGFPPGHSKSDSFEGAMLTIYTPDGTKFYISGATSA